MTRLTGETRWHVAQICQAMKGQNWQAKASVVAEQVLGGKDMPTKYQLAEALRHYEELQERFGKDDGRAPEAGESQSHGPDEPHWDSPDDDLPVLAKELNWPTYIYGKEKEPEIPIPKFTGAPELTGNFIVVGDVHVPCTDWDLARLMFRIAKRYLTEPRQILIAGDLMSMAALSHFAKRTAPIQLRQELRAANKFLEALLQAFDKIHVFLGNHDVWFMQALNGDIDIDQFARMIINVNERLLFSPYSHAFITSGSERWFVPHQSNYRQTKLSVGTELAAKKGCNVITTHQHHSAIGRDKGDRFTVVDCGGLMEPELLEYVQTKQNTKPEMTKGFCLLLNGCCHLITPYSSMTDLKMWLPREEQVRA